MVGDGAVAAGSPRQPHHGRRRGYTTRPRLAPLWLLTPAGLVMAALVVVPIVFLVFTSFTNYNQRSLFTGEFSYEGFGQYTQILADPRFWQSFVLTIVYTAVLVASSVFVGMLISELMTRLGAVLRYVLTVVLILAWAVPNVASSQVWNWLFLPGYGVMNWLLTKLRIFGDVSNLAWSNNTILALVCIALLVVWQAVPFIALTTNAAQTQVDPAYIEAARIDGASEARIYFTIVLRFLRPTVLLIVVLSIIWDFNVFNQIWLVTQGGPNNGTATLGVYSYLVAFNRFNVASGAAIAVLTTLLLLIISSFYIRNLIRSGEDL
jgi:N,N'-diacetylchitobiose transport system permease protein